jgi:CRISPR/Cas system-associated endoribonuclease Cas2
MKTISQNPDRYSKQGANWVISASPDIKPIYLTVGNPLTNLKPVIKANGIVVKIGLDYLCSLQTLNELKASNNPHYDIIENGKLKVKDKEVSIGKTIKIIELDIVKLQTLIDGRDLQNRQAGATDVNYINDVSMGVVEGIPKKLIDQINYTLDKDSERPSDKFEVVDYFYMVDSKNNPQAAHYTIKPIRTITDQEDTIFDPKRLQTFIIELDNQLKLLRRDFNRIQDTFFKGEIPTPNIYGLIIEDVVAKIDEDDQKSNHSVRIKESSELISVEPTPTQTIKDEAELASEPKPLPPAVQPPIENWRLIRKRNGDRNGMGIYPTANVKNFNTGKNNKADKRTGIIKEGESFIGYKFKTLDNGFVIWALQDTGSTTPKGYAYQGRGDNVEKL